MFTINLILLSNIQPGRNAINLRVLDGAFTAQIKTKLCAVLTFSFNENRSYSGSRDKHFHSISRTTGSSAPKVVIFRLIIRNFAGSPLTIM